jgi:predicted RNase H-like HicB family nuclease
MKKLLVVVEETANGYSAFTPDFPGCVATGKTQEQVEQAMREAVEFHIDGLRDDGMAVPEPHAYATIFDISA